MSQGKKGYPKNIGEGLTAIGDSLGEMGLARMLESGDLAQQAAAKEATAGVGGGLSIGGASNYASADPSASPAINPAAGGVVPQSMFVDPAEKNSLDAAADSPMSAVGGDPWSARSAAIAGIESGGAKNPYSLLGAVTRTGDRALGKYQVMGANVPEWTAAATGKAMTPEQFLASPEAQEAVFKNRFGGYVDKYGEEGAAKAWYAGEKGMKNPNATDIHGRLTVSGYGKDYLKRLGPRDAVAMTLAQPPVGQTGGQPPDPTLGLAGGPQTNQYAAATDPRVMSDVRPAPALPPVRTAQMAGPGYISPELPRGSTPQPVPMTEMERSATKAILDNPNNPYIAQRLAPVIKQEQEKRVFEQSRRLEQWKAEEAARQERAKIIETQRHGQAKAVQDYQKGAEELKKAQVPALQEDVRSKMIWDPTSRTFIKAPISGAAQQGPPEVKMNEGQASNLKYYNWTKEAEDTFEGKDKILADGYAQRAIGQIPFVGNALQTAKYRNAAGAAERWVQGFMRDISGAAIGTAEFDKHMRTFFPAPGDSAQDIADKKRARENAMTGMYSSTGPGREVADYYDKKRLEDRTAAQSEIEKKMQGVPREAGKISNNGKGVRMRWTGSRWEEP